ncbi:hypothetical protein NP233_g9505 [Leucocoprinus birnbaumii]|uniref:F-box domain-containing protein n=1 Tax=Leucocoprinus birnbaumii TaxID=56174 RepID=A0AAD5YN44_9AGAR|nr:hypothetical protein NP233_g9505 [Leucocoprinus birnbaumii]
MNDSQKDQTISVQGAHRQDQIDIINQKLHALETFSGDRNAKSQERVKHLRRLNAFKSPAGRLPDEILSSILKLTHLYSESTSSLYSSDSECRYFGKVSFQWREVAWSTPALWASAAFMKENGQRRNPTLVKLYFINSQSLPLHLHFSYDKPINKSERVKLKSKLFDPSVDSIILDNLPRVRTLVLPLPSPWFDPAVIRCLKNVLDLTVMLPRKTDGSPSELWLDQLKSLTTLSLRDADQLERRVFKVPFSLSCLDLRNMPVDTCVKLILQCQNAVKFQVERICRPLEDLTRPLTRSWFSHQVTSPRLEAIRRERTESEWEQQFLGCISTPMLHKLCYLEALAPPIISLAEEARFFRQASLVLSELELTGLPNSI